MSTRRGGRGLRDRFAAVAAKWGPMRFHEAEARAHVVSDRLAEVRFKGISHPPRFCLEQRAAAEEFVRQAMAQLASANDGITYDPADIAPALSKRAAARSGDAVAVPILTAPKPNEEPAPGANAPPSQ